MTQHKQKEQDYTYCASVCFNQEQFLCLKVDSSA